MPSVAKRISQWASQRPEGWRVSDHQGACLIIDVGPGLQVRISTKGCEVRVGVFFSMAEALWVMEAISLISGGAPIRDLSSAATQLEGGE